MPPANEKKHSFNVQVYTDVCIFTELLRTYIESGQYVPRSNSDVVRTTMEIAHRHLVPVEFRGKMSVDEALAYLEKFRFRLPADKRTLVRLAKEEMIETEFLESQQLKKAEENFEKVSQTPETKKMAEMIKKSFEGEE